MAPSKKVSAKKSDPGKNRSSRSSAEKNGKPARKQSEKSSEAGKKSASLKKAVRKSLKAKNNLPASPAPAVKKKSAGKPPSKPAGVKAKTVKKKVATPKAARKTAELKPSKAAVPISPASKKSLRVAKEKVPEKIKVKETAGTKKAKVRVLKPAVLKKRRKAGSRAKNPEKKSVSRGRGDNVFENIARTGLPEEYGENELIVIAVDPNVVFVDWEIKKEEATETQEGFTMRVFDVTGSESPRLSRDIFFDVKIERRVGSGFFELRMPGREVAIEIGLNDNGKFLPILRCPSVSMPRLLVSDELGIAKKMFGSALPVGY